MSSSASRRTGARRAEASSSAVAVAAPATPAAPAAARGTKRARADEGAGAGAGAGNSSSSSSAAAAAPPPQPQLPAPASFSAAGVAEEVTGAIGAQVTSWLPTATLKLRWREHVHPLSGRVDGTPLTIPPAVSGALLSTAVLGNAFSRFIFVDRALTLTKKAGGVYAVGRSYTATVVRKKAELPAARAAAEGAVAAAPELSSAAFGPAYAHYTDASGGTLQQDFTVTEQPQHTASEARARAVVAAALAVLTSEESPALTVVTPDLSAKLNGDHFPPGGVPFEEAEDEGAWEAELRGPTFRDDATSLMKYETALDDAGKRGKLSLMLASAARRRAVATAKLAAAVELFFTAET
jgi:hypothetical protein